MSVAQLVEDYTITMAIKLMLVRDYIRGLSHLHHHDIMHRDIKPSNLGVSSLHCPRGVIIDLDSATDLLDSTDHLQGTLPFLAPEIIKIKDYHGLHSTPESLPPPPPYSKSVDVWALGLSTIVLWTGKKFSWRSPALSVTETERRNDWVTREKHVRLLDVIKTNRQPTNDEEDWLLTATLSMLEFESTDRATPSALLAYLQRNLSTSRRPSSLETIQLKRKRPLPL